MRKRALFLGFCLATGAAVSLAALSGVALAGPVRGKVSGQDKLLPEVFQEASRRDAHRFTWREPSPSVRKEFRELTANLSRDVCVAALSSDRVPPAEPVLIRVTGGHSIPTTIVVQPNTKLVFNVRDPFPHKLYLVGNETSFPAQDTSGGGSREWVAPGGEGKFEIRDKLFPSIRMFVLVKPQVAAIAYPSRDGAFAMNLPSGNYTLQPFFEGRPVGRPTQVLAKDKQLVDIKEAIAIGEGEAVK